MPDSAHVDSNGFRSIGPAPDEPADLGFWPVYEVDGEPCDPDIAGNLLARGGATYDTANLEADTDRVQTFKRASPGDTGIVIVSCNVATNTDSGGAGACNLGVSIDGATPTLSDVGSFEFTGGPATAVIVGTISIVRIYTLSANVAHTFKLKYQRLAVRARHGSTARSSRSRISARITQRSRAQRSC